MKKRWVIKTIPDEEGTNLLAAELGVNKCIAQLLRQRGVNTFQEAKSFFRPDLSDLHPPFLMQDMEKAVARLEAAFEKQERILVYGDYDVDGTTAVALMYGFISSIYPQVDYYIPDRYTEGYGISTQGIDFASDNEISLIIALDCGIKSNEKVSYATSKGIDFIICDHHRPGDILPNASAVLDPKRDDCNYPFKELSGCGIGFKLIQAYAVKNKMDFAQLHSSLDLVAISIAADIVPIVGENRILAHYGLKQLNSNPREGIKAMLEIAGAKNDKELTISDIVFIIAPRINAAGRLESGKKAVELLLTNTPASAIVSSKNLNNTNTERRNLDKLITEQALSIIDNQPALINKKTTVVYNQDWHKGVVGIVASRLTEKYYRPTIVLTESNGMATGSARSVKNFDVYNAIEACADLLEQFGGHKYAAGLSLKIENIEAFQTKFEAVVSASIDEQWLIPEIEIDAELTFDEVDAKFFRVLKQFAPFGPENMHPVFLSKNIRDKGFAKIVGNNHLKFDAMQENNLQSFPAIAFGMAEHLSHPIQKKSVDICYSLDENEWNGKTSIQLNVKDIQPQP
jgi:single-stranded-DNA-specific exonuclease